MCQADQYDAGRQCQWCGDGVKPATQHGFGASVHVKADLAFDFRGDDAFDLRRMRFTFGDDQLGFLVGLSSDVLGLIACLDSNHVRFGLQRLFSRFANCGAFCRYLCFGGFRHRAPPLYVTEP